MANRPFVSVLTPTYNRKRFIPALINCYANQNYPHDRMEWIILDDGQDSVEEYFKNASRFIPNIRYLRDTQKQLIGKKVGTNPK